MHIPLQEHCDPTDKHEAFLWALTGLPGPRGAPMLISPKILREWSAHLWDLGFRQYPHEQTKEYHPPARGQQHWLNGAGRWVEKGTVPRAERITAPDITMFTPEERRHLVQQLQEHGELKHLVDRRTLEEEQQPRKASVRAHRPGHGHAGNHPGEAQ